MILEYGLSFKVSSNRVTIMQFFNLYSVLYKPARAAMLNIINSTGYFSCLKCLQPGDVVKGMQ